MNHKGQAIILGVMLFAMAFIAAVLMLKPLLDIGDSSRTSIGCELTNKTQGTYIACIAIDIFPALFFFATIGAGAGLVMVGKNAGGFDTKD